MTVRNLEMCFSFDKTVEFAGQVQFLIHMKNTIAQHYAVKIDKLECGPMPNVMVALPNVRGALCSTPQSLADAQYLTAVQ